MFSFADFAMKIKIYIQLMKSLSFIMKFRKNISSLTLAPNTFVVTFSTFLKGLPTESWEEAAS